MMRRQRLSSRLLPPTIVLFIITRHSSRGFMVSPIATTTRRQHDKRQQRICDSVAALVEESSFNEDFPDNVEDSDCPPGYYLNSVENSCKELGLLGRVSQSFETSTPALKRIYKGISGLFGMDTDKSKLGVAFALAYSIISTINGSITLSVAWYMSCKKTGLSPFAPGQWKSLLTSYGALYGIVQLLRPFRVATAIAMSKLSKEFLDSTQERLNCSKRVAVVVQYGLGWVAWLALTVLGISVASVASGVPPMAAK